MTKWHNLVNRYKAMHGIESVKTAFRVEVQRLRAGIVWTAIYPNGERSRRCGSRNSLRKLFSSENVDKIEAEIIMHEAWAIFKDTDN